MVPLGDFHICLSPNSSTRASSGVMVAHLTPTPCSLMAWAAAMVTWSLGGVAVLDAEIEVEQLDVEVREDQPVLDELPDDAGHLVTVELDDGVLDLDLRHVGGLRARLVSDLSTVAAVDAAQTASSPTTWPCSSRTTRLSATASSSRRSWRDQQQRAVEAGRRPARAARWPPGRGGWSARRGRGSSRPGPSAGRGWPGSARRRRACRDRPLDLSGAEPELGQQAAGLGERDAGGRQHGVQQRAGRSSSRRRACSTSPTTTPGPSRCSPAASSDPAEQRVEQRRLAAAVRPDDADPLGPADRQVDRTEGEVAPLDHRPVERRHAGCRCARPGRWRTGGPTAPTACRPSRAGPCACSVCRALAARFSLASMRKWRMVLSLSGGLALGPVVARSSTTGAPAGPGRASASRVARVLGVRLLGVPAGRRLLLLVGQPAPAERAGRARVLVELDDVGHGALEEGAVVADDDQRPRAARAPTSPAAPARPGRGRWSARRGGRRRGRRRAGR